MSITRFESEPAASVSHAWLSLPSLGGNDSPVLRGSSRQSSAPPLPRSAATLWCHGTRPGAAAPGRLTAAGRGDWNGASKSLRDNSYFLAYASGRLEVAAADEAQLLLLAGQSLPRVAVDGLLQGFRCCHGVEGGCGCSEWEALLLVRAMNLNLT